MTVTLHMVASLDGFVAKRDDDLSWMDASWDAYGKGVEITSEIVGTIDLYIIGSHTYELALRLGWPYGDTRTIVTTNRALTSSRKSVEFYSGDLNALLNELGQKNVWLVGGPALCREFLRLNLVDEVCLSIVPIVLGDGVALFGGSEHKLHLKDMTAFKNGMIDLWYTIIRPGSSLQNS